MSRFFIRIDLDGDTLEEAQEHLDCLSGSNDGSEALARAEIQSDEVSSVGEVSDEE